ncbi:PREDICTED: 11-beta-hydroxysteroid dehydrogenase-like 6 [Nicotiana attenuata]|uniref:11-beta-hydroxysteroid dehydrogenase 1b n=1 Tax=Nicotiana attenuata TaxID=49451 RepID=A0A1J6K0N5_NICAT|nr:PREDICTED: 11-beta-hydroxysteroid dehydrogenase-like 6 [Nicotiana attenuata]OIT23589.1 11-beta-hydroxysteroid dehydrogenase 1b [Nicotiana attenuata]
MELVLDLIHKILNAYLPHMAITALIHFMPIYLFLKFLHFIFRSIFSENVAGKVVLITGASSGIGEHLAYEYAKRGARLVLAARRRRSLQQVADMAYWLGSPDVVPVHADVSKVEDCQRLIEEAISNFGRLDHLVTNAAVTPLYMFEDLIEVTNAAPAMDINFWGAVYTTHFAIPYLKETKGKIVAIASSAGVLNAARISFYNASKAAMISFYETLRVELGTQIGITIVTPGLVESELTKGKFLTIEGKLEVDQVMRDVEMSVTPILPVQKCATAIVRSACRGDNYLTEPPWFKTLFVYRIFFPEFLEWFQRWFLFPGPGQPPTEAPSKIILDVTGFKEYGYPKSVLSPHIKVD